MRTSIQLSGLLAALAVASPTPNALITRQSCQGGSCQLADVSRSTGNPPPNTTPSGVSLKNQCILDQLAQLQKEGRLSSNACPSQVIGPCTSSKLKTRDVVEEPVELEERQLGGGCTPYTLIFAKGTFEFGDLGFIVGPGLSNALTSSGSGLWTVIGMPYDNSADNYGCLGMPGGYQTMNKLESVVASCPNTKVVVSGYSQGAEVAHNAVAWARPDVKKHVYGVATFGDPFDGAPIAGFDSSLIHTECDPGDQICYGTSMILLQHLLYGGDAVTRTAAWIKKAVGQTS